MYIKITRTHRAKVPFPVYLEAGNDWTHFLHLHRKSHVHFELIYKSGGREIFFYKSRLFYPLPLSSGFIVFREPMPAQNGYRQVYINVKSGQVHYLNSTNEQDGEWSRGTTEFWFNIPDYWKLAPRLFFWLTLRRMKKVADEDDVMMRERVKEGGYTHAACLPAVPAAFDYYEDRMKNGPPKPDFSYDASFAVDPETGEQHQTA